VKEKLQQVVQLGIHFDDYFKLVGSVGIKFPNFFIPGFQLKSLLQFSGRTLFEMTLSYPLRNKYFSLHPYANYLFKDSPITIYSEYGDKIATYMDRSSAPGFGIKFLITRFGIFKVEYNNEFILVEPDIAFPDPKLFPSWNDELRLLRDNLVIDSRDNAILPRDGLFLDVLYENSLEVFKTDLIYNRYSADINYHYTVFKYHTFRLSAFYAWASDNTPIYKYFYKGGPDTFVGFDYFQLTGPNYGIARLDYRYEYNRYTFFNIIYNISKNYYNYPSDLLIADYFQGWGVGVEFLSLIGPLEISIRPVKYMFRNKKGKLIFVQVS
jgi:outer membrane protein assembly factor BamA